jgi:hypothetical protein
MARSARAAEAGTLRCRPYPEWDGALVARRDTWHGVIDLRSMPIRAEAVPQIPRLRSGQARGTLRRAPCHRVICTIPFIPGGSVRADGADCRERPGRHGGRPLPMDWWSSGETGHMARFVNWTEMTRFAAFDSAASPSLALPRPGGENRRSGRHPHPGMEEGA